MKKFNWQSIKVPPANIKFTENNFKIKTALGRQRLQTSLKSFGMASTIVCNWTKKVGDITGLILIDGNSRLEEAIENKLKTVWVSVPDRKLTNTEYIEFSAMFDFASAGTVDLERIEKELGTTSAFYEKYGLEVPMEKMDTMGAKAAKGPAKQEPEEVKPVIEVDEYPVTLFFNKKQEAEFRKIEEKLKVRYNTISTSDTVLKALRLIK